MRNPLSKTIVEIKPSGIRKYFDIVSEMNDPDVISLGVGEPDLIHRGISVMREFIPLRKAGLFTRQMRGFWSCGRKSTAI